MANDDPDFIPAEQEAPDFIPASGAQDKTAETLSMIPDAAQQAHAQTAARPMSTSIAPPIVRGITASLPAVGMVGGGLLSGAAGMPSGPGAVAAAAAGAGLGAGAGKQAELGLNRSLFGSDEPATTSPQGLKSTAEEAGTAAGTEGLLGGAGLLANRVTTPGVSDWKGINAAIKAKPSLIRMGEGPIENAATMPGRGLALEGQTAAKLAKMSPPEQLMEISGLRKQAGKALGDAAKAATNEGTTLDASKSAMNILLHGVDSPALRNRAFDAFTAVAKDQGIDNLSSVTPEQALDLRRALGSSARFSGDPDLRSVPQINRALRGGVGKDLREAVPEIAGLDQHYSDLKAASDAALAGTRKFGVSPPPPSIVSSGVKTAGKLAAPLLGGYTGYRVLRDVLGK